MLLAPPLNYPRLLLAPLTLRMDKKYEGLVCASPVMCRFSYTQQAMQT